MVLTRLLLQEVTGHSLALAWPPRWRGHPGWPGAGGPASDPADHGGRRGLRPFGCVPAGPGGQRGWTFGHGTASPGMATTCG